MVSLRVRRVFDHRNRIITSRHINLQISTCMVPLTQHMDLAHALFQIVQHPGAPCVRASSSAEWKVGTCVKQAWHASCVCLICLVFATFQPWVHTVARSGEGREGCSQIGLCIPGARRAIDDQYSNKLHKSHAHQVDTHAFSQPSSGPPPQGWQLAPAARMSKRV